MLRIHIMAFTRFLSLLLLALMISACGLLPKEIDLTRDWSASKFYTEASESLSGGDYETAIKYYEKLESRYPFGRYAMQTQLDIAYTYYKAEEPESAIIAANRFIKLHPRNPYVDYAYYLKGIVNFNQAFGFLERFIPSDLSQRDPGSALDSFNDFVELVRKFPNSEYTEDARKRLIYLRNNLAQYEVHIARYYMKRGAYLAAANRCIHVVEKYQRTPAVKQALEIMIDAYDRMNLNKLSEDASRVLALNEEKGLISSPEEAQPKEKSLGKKLWDYLELDED